MPLSSLLLPCFFHSSLAPDMIAVLGKKQLDMIWQLSLGFPFYLSWYIHPQRKVDSTKAVVDNFLCWIPDNEFIKRRLAIVGALLSRPFHQDDVYALKDLIGSEQDWLTLYRWLIKQDFVLTTEDGRYTYDSLAQEFFCRDLYQTSPSEYEEFRKILAQYYQTQLRKLEKERSESVYDSAQWWELILARATQLFLSPDITCHTEAIEYLFNAYMHIGKKREILLFLNIIADKHPYSELNSNIQYAVKNLRKRFAIFQAHAKTDANINS